MSHVQQTFVREHHRNIAVVLSALNSDLLRDLGCYFGDGTAIALLYGEYRESVDIDFIISSQAGYRQLRELIRSPSGFLAVCSEATDRLTFTDVRTDQYGIRTRVIVDGNTPIKCEIVHEGRIVLDRPALCEQVCCVSTLTRIDMAATKLLANSDRWADRGVFSRDVIDLAILGLTKKEFSAAAEKSTAAYGPAIGRDLAHALAQLMDTKARLDDCMAAMKIALPRAVLWQVLSKLKRLSCSLTL